MAIVNLGNMVINGDWSIYTTIQYSTMTLFIRARFLDVDT